MLYIRWVEIVRKENGKYVLYSHKGKKLGEADTLEEIKKREAQVQMFKHMKNV
jgi:hypothetical protein